MIASIWLKLKNLLTPPRFPDEDDTYRARLLTQVAKILLIISVISIAPFILSDSSPTNILSVLLSNGFLILTSIMVIKWARERRFKWASTLVISTLLGITTLNGLAFGIAYFPTAAYILVITLAALFLGSRGVTQYGIISIIALIAVISVNLAFADIPPWIYERIATDTITNIAFFVLISLLLFVGMVHLEQTLIRSRQAEAGLKHLALQRENALTLSQKLLTTLSLDELIHHTLTSIAENISLEGNCFYWMDEEQNVLRVGPQPLGYLDTPDIRAFAIPLDEGIIGKVALTGSAECVNNAHLDPRTIYPRGFEPAIEHLIILPLKAQDRTLAVLVAGRTGKEARPFTQNDFEQAQLLVNHAALAVRNAQLFAETKTDEVRFRTLAENLPGAIYQCDTDPFYKILYMSDAVEEITGYPKEIFLSGRMSIKELYHPEDAPLLHPKKEDHIFDQDRDPFHYEYRIRHRNGDWRWVEDRGTSIFNEKREFSYLQGFMLDITARKEAEAEVQRLNANLEMLVMERTIELGNANRLLQALLDNSPMPIFIKSAPDWRYQVFNQKYLTSRGLTRDQILNCTDYDFYPADIADEIRVADEVVLARKETITVEIDLPDAGEEYHTFLSTKFPILNEEKHLYAIGEISLDITGRKEAEKLLRQQNEYLTTLYQITFDLLNRIHPEDILQQLLNHTLRLLDTDHANIDLLENEDEIITHIATPGQPLQKGDRTKRGEGGNLTWQAIETGEPAVLEDYNTWLQRRPIFENFPYHAIAQIPMIRENKPIGVLSISRTRPAHPFSDEDIKTASRLAQIAAVVLDNAQLHTAAQNEITERKLAEERITQINAELEQRVLDRTVELQDTNAFLSTLVDTSIKLNQNLEVDQVLDHILVQGRKFIPCRGINLMLVQDDYVTVVRRIGYEGFDELERDFSGSRYPTSWTTFNHMITTGKSIFISNTHGHPLWQASDPNSWIESFIGTPLNDVDGNAIGFLNASHDQPGFFHENHITILEALANQAAIAIQNARLLESLKTSLKNEQTARSQLIQSERLALVGRLLASVSHELNNPLQAIQNALFLLKEESFLTNQGRQDLDIVLSETERMSALIDRLRSAYRPILKSDFQPVQLNSLIEDVYALIGTHMRHKEISFEFFPDPDLPPISGISDQLRQVVLNLFLNAIEMMSTGGVLTVCTRALHSENTVFLTVKDNGPGIDPEILPHIYDPFITSKHTGTGLGLTITHDIIEQHHGRIEAQNNPEGGAAFNIWLPMDQKGGR